MILQALTDYYQALADSGKIDALPGWAPVKVSYALLLSDRRGAGTSGLRPDRNRSRKENRADAPDLSTSLRR